MTRPSSSGHLRRYLAVVLLEQRLCSTQCPTSLATGLGGCKRALAHRLVGPSCLTGTRFVLRGCHSCLAQFLVVFLPLVKPPTDHPFVTENELACRKKYS